MADFIVQVPAYGAKLNHVICPVPNRVCLSRCCAAIDAAPFSVKRCSHGVKIIFSQARGVLPYV